MIFMDDRDYTPNALILMLNETYGKDIEWPKVIGVTAATYGRICQSVFNHAILTGQHDSPILAQGLIIIQVALGEVDHGIKMKNIEFVISK